MNVGCSARAVTTTLSPKDLATHAQAEALSKLASAALARCDEVALRFRPGIYRNVHLFIDDRGRKPACAVQFSIEGEGSAGTVVFEGGHLPKFVDLVTHRAAFPGSIRNIEVRNYMNGIVVTRTRSEKGRKVVWDADTAGENTGASGLTISNVTFRRVGNQDRTEDQNSTGWGAVVFAFASGNRVLGNRFEGLGNAVHSPLMHAIYLVGSSGNVIARNKFGEMDGAVIKLRNRSESNRIEDNVFRYGGRPLLQLWFCNQPIQGSATCPDNECPSSGTVFARNRILASAVADPSRRSGGALAVKHPYVSYEKRDGIRLVERFYAARGIPKSCGPVQSSEPVLTPSDRNVMDRGR